MPGGLRCRIGIRVVQHGDRITDVVETHGDIRAHAAGTDDADPWKRAHGPSVARRWLSTNLDLQVVSTFLTRGALESDEARFPVVASEPHAPVVGPDVPNRLVMPGVFHDRDGNARTVVEGTIGTLKTVLPDADDLRRTLPAFEGDRERLDVDAAGPSARGALVAGRGGRSARQSGWRSARLRARAKPNQTGGEGRADSPH